MNNVLRFIKTDWLKDTVSSSIKTISLVLFLKDMLVTLILKLHIQSWYYISKKKFSRGKFLFYFFLEYINIFSFVVLTIIQFDIFIPETIQSFLSTKCFLYVLKKTKRKKKQCKNKIEKIFFFNWYLGYGENGAWIEF